MEVRKREAVDEAREMGQRAREPVVHRPQRLLARWKRALQRDMQAKYRVPQTGTDVGRHEMDPWQARNLLHRDHYTVDVLCDGARGVLQEPQKLVRVLARAQGDGAEQHALARPRPVAAHKRTRR